MSSVRLRATGMILAIVALSAFSRAPRAQPVDEPVDYFAHLLPAKLAWEEHCPDIEDNRSCRFKISIIGEIATGTSVKCEKVLSRWDQKERLYVILNSLGGDLATALDIGRMVRRSRGHAIVERNATCASACVLLFGAGVSRIVLDGGRIGIHRPSLAAVPRERDMDSVKAITDRTARELRAYAAEMNISERLIDDMLAVPP